LKQLRIAESEKFPHVTYFFNAGHDGVLPGETQLEIPSPKDVATYDQKPEMSQKWVTDVLLQKLDETDYDFALINFAGPDMVGHTGVIDATIKSMEIVDECIGRIVDKVLSKGGAVIITADHGNAEEMINLQTGEPDTQHSVNPVPVIIIQEGLSARELTVGILADVAPTILAMMNLEKPAEMTGRNLLA
jgi:2,3-bisphosphoglycerate-independent phosphoglycerate mutase